MARGTASAKWAEGPALDGQRDMPLALRLSEGLGVDAERLCAKRLGPTLLGTLPGLSQPADCHECGTKYKR